MTDDPRNDLVAPPDDVNGLRVPFIFVPRGDPLPTQWIAEHPDYFTVPAILVPHGTRPPPLWGDGGDGGGDWLAMADTPVQAPPPVRAEARVPDSFVPPPAREKRMRGGQPWPKDRNGGDWPADRWGRPTCPLWDYPPGMRAPGERVAPGEPGSIGEAEAIRSARTMLAVLDRAPRAFLAGDGTPTPRQGVASRYPGAYDVAEAGESVVAPAGQPAKASDHWNPQAGSDYLNNPGNGWARGKTKNECATAVRRALDAAGIDTQGHPVYAGQYGPFLQQHGFAPIPSLRGYTPKQGDVAVWQAPGGGIGHIEWFDGVSWHSDYVQNSPLIGPYATDQYGRGFSPGSVWTNGQVYRHRQ